MRICIVGGAGYIGSRLVPALLDYGYDITIYDLLWFGSHLPTNVEVIKRDVFDIQQDELGRFEQVIFLAGLSNDPMAEFSPGMNFTSNAAAPAYLAYIAKQAGVKRYIYADSCSVYGYTQDQLYDETSPTTCQYPYGISKLQGEFGVLQLADDEFSVICLRQGTVSGFSPRMRFDLIVNAMYMTAMVKNTITVNNPAIWRPLLSIDDAVTCYIRAIQADASVHGVFNVASGNYTVGSVADVVYSVVSQFFKNKIKVEIKNIKDYRNYKVSTSKAEDVLGVKFKGSVESILDELTNRFDDTYDFSDDSLYNIKVFEKHKKSQER